MTVTRGLTNRNPGNIRKSATDWRGKIVGADPEFETFIHEVYGIRALARVLLAYHRWHRLTTIREYITRWAPPVENDTEAYIRAVSVATSRAATEFYDVTAPDALAALAKAIIRHENGAQPYSDLTIREGVALALL